MTTLFVIFAIMLLLGLGSAIGTLHTIAQRIIATNELLLVVADNTRDQNGDNLLRGKRMAFEQVREILDRMEMDPRG